MVDRKESRSGRSQTLAAFPRGFLPLRRVKNGSRVSSGNGFQLRLPQSGLHKGGCSSPSGDHRRARCVGTCGHRGQTSKTGTEHSGLGCSRRNHCRGWHKAEISMPLGSGLPGKLPRPKDHVSLISGVSPLTQGWPLPLQGSCHGGEMSPVTTKPRGVDCCHCSLSQKGVKMWVEVVADGIWGWGGRRLNQGQEWKRG